MGNTGALEQPKILGKGETATGMLSRTLAERQRKANEEMFDKRQERMQEISKVLGADTKFQQYLFEHYKEGAGVVLTMPERIKQRETFPSLNLTATEFIDYLKNWRPTR